MRILFTFLIIISSFLFTSCSKKTIPQIDTTSSQIDTIISQMDTTSYSVGVLVAKSLKAQGLEKIDGDSFTAALQDVFNGNTLKVSEADAQANYSKMITEVQSRVGEANKMAGEKFLEENAKRAEVKTTASGLQYEVLQSSDSTVRPDASSTVEVHYHGTLIDGSVFDSSVDRGEPISFALNRVIKGWTEGLQLMNVGSKYRLFIPYDLAYGNMKQGSIDPFSALIFDVELLSIK